MAGVVALVKRIFLKDASGATVNPATKEGLTEVKDVLDDLNARIDIVSEKAYHAQPMLYLVFSPVSPTFVTLGDDDMTSPIAMPFAFEFFGEAVTTFRISSNGFITFSGSAAAHQRPVGPIPNILHREPAAGGILAPAIYAWSDDLDPSLPGSSIWYEVFGTAPNRRLIINWTSKLFSGLGPVTFQAHLIETDNTVQIHTTNTVLDLSGTDAGFNIQGLEGSDGVQAAYIEGRQGKTKLLLSSDAVAFIPFDRVRTATTEPLPVRALQISPLDTYMSFDQALSGASSKVTNWSRIDDIHWLDFLVELGAAQACTATIEFTSAADPNVTSPGAGDVTRAISTTIAGASLGGITKPSFGIPAQGLWARITVTNLVGSGTVKVRAYRVEEAQASAQVPLATTLTKDFRASITRAVISGQRRTAAAGFANAGLTALDELIVRDQKVHVTQTGSLFQEGILDHVTLKFSRDGGAASLAKLVNAYAAGGGTVVQDTVEGQAVFATPAAAGKIAYFESNKTLKYNAGHTNRFEQTIRIDTTNLVGNAAVEWGAGEDDGSGNILNGIYWRLDTTGLRVRRKKNGVVVSDVAQASFNRDPLLGQTGSLFRTADAPVAINAAKNNYYLGQFEWLGAAPPHYEVQGPTGDIILAHVEEYPNTATGSTVPEPELPLFVRIQNDTTVGGIIEVRSGSWRGGEHSNRSIQTGRQPDEDLVDLRADGTAWTTSTPLGISGTFLSPIVDTDGYASLEIFIAADQISASNGIEIEFFEDVQVPVPVVKGTIRMEFATSDVSAGFRVIPLPALLDGCRVRYINGGTAQGSFFAALNLRTQPIAPEDTARATIKDSTLMLLVRGLLNAKDGTTGTYANIDSEGGGLNVNIKNSTGRVKVSPLANWDHNQVSVGTVAVQLYASAMTNQQAVGVTAIVSGNNNIYWGNSSGVTTGNGDFLPNQSEKTMDLGTGDEVWVVADASGQRVSYRRIAE
jgi:hypothetical protein